MHRCFLSRDVSALSIRTPRPKTRPLQRLTWSRNMGSLPNALKLHEIDGSVLEGGGQILRNSVSFSALLRKPVKIINIRENRKPPGLKNQHAAGIRLAAEICGAQLVGDEIGSRQLQFTPGAIQSAQNYIANPGTAGSTTLLLQVGLPILLFAPQPPPSVNSHAVTSDTHTSLQNPQPPKEPTPSVLTLHGGTNATSAPPIDDVVNVFLPFARRHLKLEHLTLNILKRGYFPRGGGEVRVCVPPLSGPLPAFNLTERGRLVCVNGRAYVAGVLPLHIAQKYANSAEQVLRAALPNDVRIDVEVVMESEACAVGSGSGITLWAETDTGCMFGASGVGAKGKDARKLGEAVAKQLLNDLEGSGCVDEHMQDQIVIFMALAAGTSTVRTGPLSLHTRTAIWVAEQLTDAKFEVDEADPNNTTIVCHGIGHTAQ